MAITFTPILDSDPIELIISGSPGGIFDGHVVSASVLLDGSTGQIATFGAGGGSGSGGGLAVTDQAAFIAGSSSLTPTGGVYNDGLAALATPGQQGLVRITPNRALHLNLRRQDGTETGTSTTPLVTSGTIAQGAAAAITAPWSVALSDGTNLLGTELHPLNVNEGNLNSANDSVTAVFSNVVPVALASLPTATNAASATTLKWTTDINHFNFWNASGAPVYVDWTGGTAGVYSWPIAANSGLIQDVHVPAAQGISVYTAGAAFLNTSTPANATNNLVLIGEL